jgi:hypothetical protein
MQLQGPAVRPWDHHPFPQRHIIALNAETEETMGFWRCRTNDGDDDCFGAGDAYIAPVVFILAGVSGGEGWMLNMLGRGWWCMPFLSVLH